MTLADWLVVSVTVHYVLIGILYAVQQGQPLMLGLYGMYAGANAFLILISQALARMPK
jgi:hypothetical protein